MKAGEIRALVERLRSQEAVDARPHEIELLTDEAVKLRDELLRGGHD